MDVVTGGIAPTTCMFGYTRQLNTNIIFCSPHPIIGPVWNIAAALVRVHKELNSIVAVMDIIRKKIGIHSDW